MWDANKTEIANGSERALDMDNIKFKDPSWWNRRTRFEKKLVVLFVLALLIAIVLLIVVIVLAVQRPMDKDGLTQSTPTPPKPVSDLCTTHGCVIAAARILERVNLSVDPCDNFYDFACGTWMENNVIPEGKLNIDIFSILNDALSTNLKTLIETPPAKDEVKSITAVKDYYKSCMDLGILNARGSKPLMDNLVELGGWPMITPNWNESSFQLETMLQKLIHFGVGPIISAAGFADFTNGSINKLYFSQPDFGLSNRLYYLLPRNASSLMAYQSYITNVAVVLGADSEKAGTEAEEIVDFEIQLANISVDPTTITDTSKLYNAMPLKQMMQTYPEFEWVDYATGIMSAVGINITEDLIIVNAFPSYFGKLFSVLANTPKRIQANYILWRFIQPRVKLLDAKLRTVQQVFDTASGSIAKLRSEKCIGDINEEMPMAVARLYVDAHFDETAKATMLQLISYLREAFNELLDEVDWLDDATRAAARDKAEAMKEMIGYPDAIKNNSYLDTLYEQYTFNASDYYGNFNLQQRLAVKKNLRSLKKINDKNEWPVIPPRVLPAIVNAANYLQTNTIIFPAAFLQPPIYKEDQPWSIKFGGIGSFIGHEITHGFDNNGRQRDKEGNLRQWWPDDVIERFNNESQCFINQTSNFFWPEAGAKLNGKITVTEDVADNGGVKQSYRTLERIRRLEKLMDFQENPRSHLHLTHQTINQQRPRLPLDTSAYRKWVTRQGKEEPLLPGISLNNNQLFFLAWAQFWCNKIKTNAAKYQLQVETHGPGRFRAVGPLQNLPEFAEVYKCKKDSPMNPSEKCSLW